MDYKNVVLALLCLVCLAGIGCGGFIDRFTPSEITVQSTDYANMDSPPLGILSVEVCQSPI